MEALGTFFLLTAFGTATNPIAAGLVLSVLIYLGRPVSGGHFNPAVSLAFFLRRKLSFSEFSAYSASQIMGAFAAAGVLYFFSTLVFYIEPPASTNLYQQATAEVLFSFLFVLVFLMFSLSPNLNKNQVHGFAIGLTFTAVLLIGSQISGGAFNPAFSISTALLDLIKGGNSYYYLLLYILGPFAGSALAAFAFSYFQD